MAGARERLWVGVSCAARRRFLRLDVGISVHPYETRLYSGDLQEILDLRERGGVQSLPEHWWPNSRDWCVNTDWDLPFTLIGGPADLIRRFGEHPDLEAVAVNPDTRIDAFADERKALRRLKQVAKLVLNNRIETTEAARVAIALSRSIPSEFAPSLVPFAAIERQTRHLPIGPVRALWAQEQVQSPDAELRRVLGTYHDDALKACKEILSILSRHAAG